MRAVTEELGRFLDHAVAKGMDYTSVHQLLRAAGWRERDIARVFCARHLELPLPVRSGGSSARDTFFQLLAFTALYVWVIELVLLLFNILDIQFPEPGRDEHWRLSAMRRSLAAILVAFPLFSVLWRRMWREIKAQPERAATGPRRWLTHFSLYVAAVTVLANAITLVHYLLEGEQTLRFLLKVAVLFVVAASAFAYLSATLRWTQVPEARP
jgi:hypothetical protein